MPYRCRIILWNKSSPETMSGSPSGAPGAHHRWDVRNNRVFSVGIMGKWSTRRGWERQTLLLFQSTWLSDFQLSTNLHHLSHQKMGNISVYPLVISHIANWKISTFEGKNYYFYGQFRNVTVIFPQAIHPIKSHEKPPFSYGFPMFFRCLKRVATTHSLNS